MIDAATTVRRGLIAILTAVALARLAGEGLASGLRRAASEAIGSVESVTVVWTC
jgi:hypothetical protein